MQIIKDQKLIDNLWQHLGDDDVIPTDQPVTVTLSRWLREMNDGQCRQSNLGVRLGPDDLVEDIAEKLGEIQMVSIYFPAFTDGRCFSIARLLRNRYGYQGEIRAIGDFLPDQVFFLARVGFNAFEFDDPDSLQEGLDAFSDFSVKYQASSDIEEPLFKRVEFS